MSLIEKEFVCKHCGGLILDPDFFLRAQEARRIADTSFIITSGYRCLEHNKAIGSTSMNHVLGKAMDVAVDNDRVRWNIIRGLVFAGFTRVGIAKTFIHADSMDKPSACWLYKEEKMSIMGGWKTWIGVVGFVVMGIYDLVEGQVDQAMVKFAAAWSLIGIGHKIEKNS